MYRVSISQFQSGLGWDKHRKVWHEICDCSICSFIFMKKHSRYCIKNEGGTTTSKALIIWRSTSRRSSSCSKWKNYRRWYISSSLIDFIRVVSGSGTYSELYSTGKSKGWTSTSPLSMSWWLSIPIIAETAGIVLGGYVLDLKWAAGCWPFHSLGDPVGSSSWRALNWITFILRICGRNLGPRMMQASHLFTILPQN